MAEDEIRTMILTMETDRSVYGPGEPVTVTLSLRNQGAEPIARVYATSQRYDVDVTDTSGREVWRLSADRLFAQMLVEESIGAGETVAMTETFPAPVEPGSYVVRMTLASPDRSWIAHVIEVRTAAAGDTAAAPHA